MGQYSSPLHQLLAGESNTAELGNAKGGGRGAMGTVTFKVHHESGEAKAQRIANQEQHEARQEEELARLSKIAESLTLNELSCQNLRDLETTSVSDPVCAAGAAF